MTLASGGVAEPVLWDVATGAAVCQFEPPAHRVLAIAFSADGQRLAFGTDRREPERASAAVWDLESGRGIRALRGLAGSVAKVAISPSGRLLAALSNNWQVGIWSLDQTRLLHRLEPPPGFFVDNADLIFSPDDSRFVFSAGERATVWDTKTGQQVKRLSLPPGLQDSLAFDASGKRLLLFRFETEGAKVGPFGEYPWTEHPRVCRLRDLLAADYRVPLWEAKEFNRHVYGLRASCDGKFFVLDGRQVTKSNTNPRGEHLMAVYDGTTGKALWMLPRPDDSNVGRPGLDPSGTLLATEGSGEPHGALIELANGRIMRYGAFAPCLSPHATYYETTFRSEYGDGTGLYRTGDEQPLVVLALDDVAASCYQNQFSRDGRLMAWPSRNGSIYVAEIQEVRRQLAHLGLGW
jgi:dipeptidyl aminopeptidase/acylaminoacyl peptidase